MIVTNRYTHDLPQSVSNKPYLNMFMPKKTQIKPLSITENKTASH